MLAVLVTLLLAAPADIIDRIMAVVGTQPITLTDVSSALQLHLVEVPEGSGDPRAYVLDRLIDRTLMLAEVDRFQPPEPDPIEITLRVDRMQQQAGSAAAFDHMLSVTGMTRDQLRRFVRDSLRADTYVNQRFGAILDPAERKAAVAAWVGDLRRRSQLTVLYRPAVPSRGSSR
jgi:hypothetical protein